MNIMNFQGCKCFRYFFEEKYKELLSSNILLIRSPGRDIELFSWNFLSRYHEIVSHSHKIHRKLKILIT